MKKLSELSKRIDGQPMFKLLDKVKKLEQEGRDIIHFEIGDPDFETPENIANAGIRCYKKWIYTLYKFVWSNRISTENL